MARKLLGLILLLVVGAVVGAPYVVGMQMEQLHSDYMQKSLVPGMLELKSTQFDRGWFKSTAKDTFTFSGPACAMSSCKPLVVDIVIYHGPLAIAGILDGAAPIRPIRGVIISHLDFSSLLPEGGIDPALPPLESHMVVELDGSSNALVSMKPSQHTLKGKDGTSKLSLGGIEGHIDATANPSHTQGKLDLASVRIESANGAAFELKDAGIDFDGSADNSDFLGKFTESVASVSSTDPARQTFDLQGLAVHLDDKTDSNAFDLGFKNMNALGRPYGPVNIEGEVKGINHTAMQQIQAESQAQTSAGESPLEAMSTKMAVYQNHMSELMKTNPELSLKTISIKTPDGEILGNLRIGAGAAPGTPDLAGLLQSLKMDVNLQIPAVTLWNLIDIQKQQAAQKIAALTGTPAALPSQNEIVSEVTKLVQTNILVPKLDANAYTLQLSLHDGHMTLNGQVSGGTDSLMGLFAPSAQAAGRLQSGR